MLKQRTFKRGGIHPPDKKHMTIESPITPCEDPPELVIPLSQHLGAPAQCLVSKGDLVQPGDVIGESSSFISARVHTPLGGEVTEIRSIFLPTGLQATAVVIAVDRALTFTEKPVDAQLLEAMEPGQMIKQMQDAGIAGMGGAAFPAHVKFSIPKGKHAQYLIINGVECEPYLNADNRLMVEHTQEVLDGAAYIQRMIGADSVIIGIEENKPEAIKRIRQLCIESGYPFRVQPLKVQYPQGDEKQLIEALIDREVPSGGLPIDIGAVVSNIGTTFAVYEALRKSKPLFERIVTVSGEAVQSPMNIRAKIGTPFRHLIELAGGIKENAEKVIAGGPMMGFAVYDLNAPVMKGTSGILALTSREVRQSRETPCISCGRCVRGCPMGLQPTRLYHLIQTQMYDQAKAMYLLDCKECGCCAYSCPAKLPLVQGMRLGKQMLRNLS